MTDATTAAGPGRRRPRGPLLAAGAVAVAVAVAVGLWAFQPWRLFTSSTLDEAPPAVAASGTASTSGTAPASVSNRPAPAGPVVLAEGRFVSQEHPTTGSARVLALPDGSHVLRLENLDSSDGPDLHVWLTDQAAGGADGGYDDGRYVALGELKATSGNQNYVIPAGTDLTGLRSAVIWCDRFNVAFGSAPLSL